MFVNNSDRALLYTEIPLSKSPSSDSLERNSNKGDYVLSTEISDDDIIRLKNDMQIVYYVLEDLCTSIVRCDDIALLERDVRHQGAIITALGPFKGQLERQPLTLRTSVLDIANKYQLRIGDGNVTK